MCPDAAVPSPNGIGAPRVFISAKSQDYDCAASLYGFLSASGIPAFFSRESLPELGSSDYRREIDRALDVAEHMLVVASSVENIQSSWVEAEWGFFINEKRSGRKRGNLLTVLVGGLRPGDLPPSLRYYEAVPYEPDGFDKLLKYLSDAPAARPTIREAAPAASGKLAFVEAAVFGSPPPARVLASTSDGRTLATGGFDGAVRLYDVATRSRRGFLASNLYHDAGHESLITALDFSPDGQFIAAGYLDGRVHVWNVDRDAELAVGMGHQTLSALFFSADGSTLVTAGRDGLVKSWDMAAVNAGEARHVFFKAAAEVVAACPLDGRRRFMAGLADTGSRRYTVHIHELAPNCPECVALALADPFARLAVSDGGKTMATGSADGTVRMYRIEPWTAAGAREKRGAPALVNVAKGHKKSISSMAFVPGTQRVMTAAAEHKIQVWDSSSTDAICRMQGSGEDQIASVAPLGHGRQVAGLLADGRIRVWEAV